MIHNSKNIIFVIVLIVGAVILIRSYFRDEECSESLKRVNLELSVYRAIAYFSSYTIEDEGKSWVEPLSVTYVDESGKIKESDLKNILPQSSVLVFRFSNMHCDECVNSTIEILKKVILENPEIKNNVIILASYNSIVSLNVWKNAHKLDLKMFMIPEGVLRLNSERAEKPYLFIAKQNGNLTSLFIPMKEKTDLTFNYLKIVQNRFLTLRQNDKVIDP